ncbi:hypothetical protein PHYSODRAFT_297781 [Phytophthora sojae]|uniref:RxLR effector protein n=1 Tax=Phytophthora sojae (strain P6497) TaxID=1094619 RepID=G4Z8T2_PHYSP|nr:hypothetical protein PHYSODRAFT_297781 [Phytophthora sojae]EGZ19114.1 hypothetical protein PHYSODRAFT_297781 [Phytophthora sojae]|eukprot:XP_009521831.1 hypothetical protein PHYSODRAFT_297781 [Phytophthora sojae]
MIRPRSGELIRCHRADRSRRGDDRDQEVPKIVDETEDLEDEEGAANVNLIDDFVVNARKTTLSMTKLEKLVTPKVALKDPKQRLIRELYEGKVAVRKFAQVLKANPNRETNRKLLRLYKWFCEFRISRAKAVRFAPVAVEASA